MRRVMIIGGPGAGKTWLAHALGEITGLPVIGIDSLLHDETGKLHDAGTIDARAMAVADAPAWIIEGGNSRTYAYRAERAACIILLDPPRWRRLWRVWRRDGWNWTLLQWTWRYDGVFGSRDREVVNRARGRVHVHELRSDTELNGFLHSNAK